MGSKKKIKQKNKILYPAIVTFLSITALVLGGLIYLDSDLPKFSFPERKNDPVTSKSQQNTPQVIGENNDVLNTPQQNATEEEKKKHYLLVQKNAKETNTLDIKNCKSTPSVVKITEGNVIIVTNPDTTEHTLTINPEYQYIIPAQSTFEIKTEFGKGSGWYGYGCDNSPKTTGIFFITPTNE